MSQIAIKTRQFAWNLAAHFENGKTETAKTGLLQRIFRLAVQISVEDGPMSAEKF
jgi:hypothetical protein